jgi:hypothetical protein
VFSLLLLTCQQVVFIVCAIPFTAVAWAFSLNEGVVLIMVLILICLEKGTGRGMTDK